MVILGVTETMQLMDGSEELPVLQHIIAVATPLALASPALAAAADALANAEGFDRITLENQLETMMASCADSTAPGLLQNAPLYGLYGFCLRSARSFGLIRPLLPDADIYLVQTMAIAHANDIPLLLIHRAPLPEQVAMLRRLGIGLEVEWITASQ